MKRVLLFLVISGLTTVVAFGQKKEIRNVQGFTGINASSVFDVTVTKGGAESLSIEADDDVMQYVRSEVKKGVLYLYLDNKKAFRNIKTLKASIVMESLDKVTLSGACKLKTNDTFASNEFKADCSGASHIDVNLNTGQLSIEASGACNILIKADVSGDSKIEVSGASKIQGELKTKNVKYSSSGVCSANLSGSATDIKINTSGTSKINAGDFAVKSATIVSSGTSSVTVNASEFLKINSSGATSVNYKGSPSIQTNSSKAAKINKI